MAITTTYYNSYKKLLLDKSIDHTNDTFKIALLTADYTPDIDTHDFFDDITDEVSGSGYTAGGYTLSGKSTSIDTSTNKGVFDASDITNATTTLSAVRYAILYKSTGTSSTSPLIAYIDLGEDYYSVSGSFSFTWNANGIINIA